MSAPIGSAFEPLWKFENKPYKRVDLINPNTLLPLKDVEDVEKSIIVFKIKNTLTGEFWSNGRWRKNGKVYTRKSDVFSVLNNMSAHERNISTIKTYDLIPQKSKDDVVRIDLTTPKSEITVELVRKIVEEEISKAALANIAKGARA